LAVDGTNEGITEDERIGTNVEGSLVELKDGNCVKITLGFSEGLSDGTAIIGINEGNKLETTVGNTEGNFDEGVAVGEYEGF
jgi:hypothetical protein